MCIRRIVISLSVLRMSLLCHVLSQSPGILCFWSAIVRLERFFFFFAVAVFLYGVGRVLFVQYCFVVACYYLLHVGHAAVAEFYCVSI